MAVTSTVIASSQKRIQKIFFTSIAAIAQLGERQTEDLKVPGSIPGPGIYFKLMRVINATNVIVQS